MVKYIFGLFLLVTLTVEGQSQNSDVPPDAQPGKCYAKCIIPDSTSKTSSWSKWEEVLCSQDITASVVRKINLALKDKNYNVDVTETAFSAKSKAALNKFQKAFNLPVGNLNIKTLEALGVRY